MCIIYITEIRCTKLQSSSMFADCKYNDRSVSCFVPALPQTIARLTCSPGYREDTRLTSSSRVRCNNNGQWEPEPIKCIPGPLTIIIYSNDSSVLLQTDVTKNNSTFIEVLNDKIVIHIYKNKTADPDIDIRFDIENKK